MLTDNEIHAAFDPLWDDLQDEPVRPFLAHYTSIATLEQIMKNDEVWFSNPLYMNDMEELRFVMLEGAEAFRKNQAIKRACGESRYKKLLRAFEVSFDQFNNSHAFDTYVFCMAAYEGETNDGLLSMWRGYGGNGTGAAIIFDTAKFSSPENDDGLFILSDVKYASHAQRRRWIEDKLSAFANLLTKIHFPDEKLHLPMHTFFERLKIYALFTKHHGFSEEKEWRIAYLKDRDQHGVLHGMLDYAIGRNGLEPKLKFKVQAILGATIDDFSLETIVSKIILGPSISSALSVLGVKRMLEKAGKHKLAERLSASTTPFRAV